MLINTAGVFMTEMLENMPFPTKNVHLKTTQHLYSVCVCKMFLKVRILSNPLSAEIAFLKLLNFSFPIHTQALSFEKMEWQTSYLIVQEELGTKFFSNMVWTKFNKIPLHKSKAWSNSHTLTWRQLEKKTSKTHTMCRRQSQQKGQSD